jgi:hypothetical protein
VCEGRGAVVHGGRWHRRVHPIHDGRGAAAILVTALARQVLEDSPLPRIDAVFAARGVICRPGRPDEGSTVALTGTLSQPQCHAAEVVVDGHGEMPQKVHP